MKLKLALLTFAVFLTVAPGNSALRTDYYYTLFSLKEAREPEKLRMLKYGRDMRSTRLVKGVLFTYRNIEARKVSIAGNFTTWSPRPMMRSKYGVWYFFLDEFENAQKVQYKYQVDGIWIMDPENPDRTDDGAGSYISLANPIKNTEGKQLTYRILDGYTVEFRLYKPNAHLVSIVGDFNHWNPEIDMLKKDKKGVWRITKRLSRGQFRYKYIVDGEWVPDIYNEKSGSDITGQICSIIKLN